MPAITIPISHCIMRYRSRKNVRSNDLQKQVFKHTLQVEFWKALGSTYDKSQQYPNANQQPPRQIK